MGHRFGQAFENLLDYTNRIYQNKGIALINKRPTPVKVLRTKGNRILAGVYDKKSTVDYDGIYQGCAIAFEAKTTKLPRLPLDMIADHQVKYLDNAEDQGAISFLIVNLRHVNETYILTNAIVQDYIDDAKKGGRKSIPYDDIVKHGIKVKGKNGVPLDYLKAVDELISIKMSG